MFFPLTNEVATAAAAMIAEMIKVILMPSTNTSAATPRVDELIPIKRAESVLLETKDAKTALIMARLID